MSRHERGTRSAIVAMVATVGVLGLLAAGCGSTDSDQGADGAGRAGGVAADLPEGVIISGPPDGTEVTPGGEVIMAIEAEPEGLDPTRYAFSSSGSYVGSAVYDTLATIDDEGNAVPFLAEDITGNEDNTVWTITVRDGVTFHNGAPADTDAIMANLEAHRTSLITQLAVQTVESIEKVADDQIQVTLTQPWRAFPSLLTSQVGYVLEPKGLEENTLATSPVGTGPFSFESHVPAESWSFTKYGDYWRTADDGASLPYLDSIEFDPIPDDAARLKAFEDGSADVMITSTANEIRALRAGNYKTVEYSIGEEEFILLNTEQPPFDDLDARRAVAHAVDSQTHIDEQLGGIGVAVNSPFAPGQPGYLEDNGYPAYDLDESRRLVSDYEARTGQPFEFSFLSVDDPDNVRINQSLKDIFESVGMKVTVESLPQINLIAQTVTGNYQMSSFRNFGSPLVDTDTVFWKPSSVLETGVSLNMPRFRSDELQSAIERALAATDEGERTAAWEDVNRIMAEQVPYVWLDRPVWILAAKDNVNGIYAAANGSIQTLGSKTWVGELWVQR